MHFRLFLPFLYLGALLVLDYVSRRAVSTRSIFSSTMFGASYSRFFFFFTVIGGFLVYFSTQHSAVSQFKVPEEVLNPTLNFVVDRAIEQVQEQFGSQELSEEQFLEELKKTGLLEVLQEQFNITLGEGEVGTPDRLAQNLSESLREQLGQDLDLFIADFLGPYLPFIPLIASLGVALSLLFLTPVFTLFCIGVFELVYRGLVGLRVLKFEEETRQVRVLKIG
ncbi:hypothetical protein GTO10_02230, partial [Candidatus Saccharibacteria bacterium]|nr:hypothetical protein [Candidatus Saccharibacteria bacterium]